ncbi:unnamed protein product [Ectocarpus sp. 13 AM-2016]
MGNACSNTDTFSGQVECLNAGSCTAETLLPVAAPLVVGDELCDGTRDSITLTGDLVLASSGRAFDVGMWIGPIGDDPLCTRYGFKCEDQDAVGFDIDGDGCADFEEVNDGGDNVRAFRGVSWTAPCKGNDVGDFLLDLCLTWKTADGNTDCTDIDGIVSLPGVECICGEASFDVIKVCPTDLTVTTSTSTSLCLGDGVDVTIDIPDIPTDADIEYVIKDEDGNEVSSGQLAGTTTLAVPEPLVPDVDYTIDVTLSFASVGLECATLSFDLEPICSCGENNANCVCNPATDVDCPSGDLICCKERDVCDEFSTGADGGTACGDPHMTGFLGQKFDFTGEDGGWYSVIADSNMNVNMRVTSPVAELPEITYITGSRTLIPHTAMPVESRYRGPVAFRPVRPHHRRRRVRSQHRHRSR